MANEVIDFELTTDPVQAKVALNAAFDGTTQTALKAGDVKDSINGVALSEIFENDNKTVKKATSAESATLAEAAKADKRFQISASGYAESDMLPGTSFIPICPFPSGLAEGQQLVLKKIRAFWDSSDNTIAQIQVGYIFGDSTFPGMDTMADAKLTLTGTSGDFGKQYTIGKVVVASPNTVIKKWGEPGIIYPTYLHVREQDCLVCAMFDQPGSASYIIKYTVWMEFAIEPITPI